jgi:hypothetical protein
MAVPFLLNRLPAQQPMYPPTRDVSYLSEVARLTPPSATILLTGTVTSFDWYRATYVLTPRRIERPPTLRVTNVIRWSGNSGILSRAVP